MIYGISATPGHGKTQRALWLLLNDVRFKGRRVYFANVRGLNIHDARLERWTPLTDVKLWQQCDAGSVIFIDECHQSDFFPLRGVGKPPAWIEDLATHRHLGVDFLLVSQNFKNIDPFVRRLMELHIHLKRPAQLGYTNIYEFQGYTDCDTRIPTDSALRHERWRLDKNIWSLYESAEQHTAKAKIPRIVYVLPLAIILTVSCLWYGYAWFANMGEKAKANQKTPVDKLMVSSGAERLRTTRDSAESPSLSRLSPQARVEHLMHQQRDWGFDRVPVDPDFPESAAIFDDVREVKTFPRLVATVVKDGKCIGYNQQGIAERQVSQAACVEFAVNGRFNPYFDEKKDRDDSRRAAQPPSAKDSSTPYQPPYLVYGLNGQPTLETRAVGYSVSNASSQTLVDAPQPQRPATLGAPGASGSLGGNGIVRGGFVEQSK